MTDERKKESLSFNGLMGKLCARFDLSREVKSRSSNTAFVASGSRRGKIRRAGAKRKKVGKEQGSRSGDIRLVVRLHPEKKIIRFSSICKETGYKWFNASQWVCSTCRETGHDLAVLDHQASLVADAESESCEFVKSNDAKDAFVSVSQGEYEFRFGCSGGTEGLDCGIKELYTWIVDSAATRHMTPSPVSMTNSREYDGVIRIANDVALPIEGVGDILMRFRSDFREIDLQLLNVTFVPLLSHNFLSL